ncbi:hypothetical protein H0H92_005435, partial [Tricholoma furcatifolium]
MHATSVAVAIIALNAASALAGPTSNNFYRRTTPDGAAPAVKADAAGGAGGAIPTTTVYYPPKATPCKAGETPNATKGASHKHKHKSKAEAAHHGTGAEPDNKAAAVQPRAPAPTKAPRSTGTDQEGSDQEGSDQEGSDKPKQHKKGPKGPHTQTDTDSNGTPTLVRVFVPEETHRCYAPTGNNASSHGSASGSKKVEARTNEEGHASDSSSDAAAKTITRHHHATIIGGKPAFIPVTKVSTKTHTDTAGHPTLVVVFEPKATGEPSTKGANSDPKSAKSDSSGATKVEARMHEDPVTYPYSVTKGADGHMTPVPTTTSTSPFTHLHSLTKREDGHKTPVPVATATSTSTVTHHHSLTKGADGHMTPVPVATAHTVVVVYEPGTGDQGTKDAKKSVASDPTSGTKIARAVRLL